MQSSITNLKSILFMYSSLLIPTWQRSFVYSPGKRNILERLLNDLAELNMSMGKKFLGTIITQKVCSDDPYQTEICIDGQQRLTTLLLILKALFLKAEKNGAFIVTLMHPDGTPIIVHRNEDRQSFSAVMALTELSPIEKDDYIANTWKFIVDWTNKNFDKESAFKKAQTILDRIIVDKLVLDEQDNAQEVFENINYGGVPLSTADLLNVFLLGKNEELYNSAWYPVFDTREAQAYWDGNEQGKTVDKFLRAVACAMCWQYKSHPNWKTSDSIDFVKEANVYTTITQFHLRFGTSKDEIAKQICWYAAQYRKYFSKESLEKTLPAYGIERIACIIMAQNWTSVTPYILYVLKNVGDESERNQIFKVVERYLVRLLVAKNDGFTKPLSEYFSESLILNNVLTAKDLEDSISAIDARHYMPGDEEIHNALACKYYQADTIKLIHYLLENKREDSQRHGFNHYSCEQLESYKCWGKDLLVSEEKQKKLTSKLLANYVLINETDQSNVRSNGGQSYMSKRRFLLNASKGIATSSLLLNHNEAWGEECIKARAKILARKIIELWPDTNRNRVRLAA